MLTRFGTVGDEGIKVELVMWCLLESGRKSESAIAEEEVLVAGGLAGSGSANPGTAAVNNLTFGLLQQRREVSSFLYRCCTRQEEKRSESERKNKRQEAYRD